jgi:hypothetical protein
MRHYEQETVMQNCKTLILTTFRDLDGKPHILELLFIFYTLIGTP